MSKKKISLSILVSIIIIVIFIAIISNTTLVAHQYSLDYKNLPDSFDGFKIVLLSDLHSKQFGKGNKNLIETIDRQSPDIIVMTGDMINSTDKDYSAFISLAEKIAKKYSVYYVVGNHEQSISEYDLELLYDELKNSGVIVLDNEKASVEKNNESINIYGMWFNLRYYSNQSNEYVKNNAEKYSLTTDKIRAILGDCNKDKLNILLTHNPIYFDYYCEWGADLTLSGHMHGGLIRLPFVDGIYSPERVFFPKYDAGLFSSGDRKMIVSRGLGNSMGFRFLNCPELVVITLNKK